MNLIIIAAGEGSRLRAVSGRINKTLLKIGPDAILDILIRNAGRAGVSRVVIVTGYNANRIEGHVAQMDDPGITVDLVHNPDWKLANGVSVLRAQETLPENEPFLISMSDHIYSRSILERMMDSNLQHNAANVAIDYRINDIFDLDDGMKVAVTAGDPPGITAMDKLLPKYDAIDCGVFKCRYEFLDLLAQSARQGRSSLSDACNLLIDQGRMGGIDIGNAFWMDIDTPEALEYCQANLSAVRDHIC